MTLYEEKFDTRETPDRVFYEAGVFLDADDLRAEQIYHRGRLTRVLNYLHGTGTAAGLRVSYDAQDDEIQVSAGIAIDRLGRLIEVPRQACVRIDRWLDHQRAMLANPDQFEGESLLLEALTPDELEVVVDVFLRFAVCPRGRTPAFATGPFDAIDASVPHRLRDSYELSLELRGGDNAPLPDNPWPARGAEEAIDAWQARLRAAVLDGWKHGTESWEDGQILPDASTAGVEDRSAVFLTRLRIPVTVSSETGIPERRIIDGVPAPVVVDDRARQFVLSSAALIRWLEAITLPFAGPNP